MRKVLFLFSTGLFVMAVLIIFVFFKYNDQKLHVVICDVGQGDAIFIRTSNQIDILVDGGPDKRVLKCLSRHMPFWDRTLDLVIMTHPDADHSTGLIDVIKRYQVRFFYTEEVPGRTEIYKLLVAILAEKNLSAKYLHSGDGFKDKTGFGMLTLWPSLKAIRSTDQNRANLRLNELSVVQLLTYGNFKVLLTGDAGSKVMDKVAAEARSINILKVPHHGSRTGMTDNFLKTTSPDLALISVGSKNKYGHPAGFSLDLLRSNKIKTLRTDINGEIEIISDGLIYYIKTDR